jgi:FkbM family methyltransferase
MILDLETNEKIWIYGSGSFSETVISQLEEVGFSILGVIDHMNVGKEIKSIKNNFIVKDFSHIRFEPRSQIVLAVCNLHGDLQKIVSEISLDIECASPVELYRMLSQHGWDLNHYWLSTDIELFSRHGQEIDNFRNLLGDEESRKLLDSIISYRQFGNISDLPYPRPLNQQYLADDLSTPPQILRVIDLGACQGENLSAFLEAGREFIDGHLFEPDKKNMKILQNLLVELNLQNFQCHELGAWQETTSLRFDADGTTGAALSLEGSHLVEVVALDEFIPDNFIPNLIKMDIEGAELEALVGMKGIIEKHSPHLAVSAYHKPTDLWALGNYLSGQFPEKYSYYLRVYGHQTFDTVLYAIPKN